MVLFMSTAFFFCFFFSKLSFTKKVLWEISSDCQTNGLDQDQVRWFVGPDLVPNCLKGLSADDTNKQIVISINQCFYDVWLSSMQYGLVIFEYMK